jgi:hypothetical protein
LGTRVLAVNVHTAFCSSTLLTVAARTRDADGTAPGIRERLRHS